MILKFEINWGLGFVIVENPGNADGIIIDFFFTSQNSNAIIRNLDLEWMGDTALKMNVYKRAGLSGGVGITEGLPLRISGCSKFFDGYIDLQSQKTRWECDKVVAPCVEHGRADWVLSRARGFTFKFLRDLQGAAPGRIRPLTDYKKTPYTITKHRTRSETITLELEIAALALQIADTIRQLSACINDMLGSVNPLTLPKIIFEMLNILLYVVYLIALFVVIIKLIQAFVSEYFQLKKYKLCMTWETCFTRIAEKLGCKFKSTILQTGDYVGYTWMPRKNIIPNPSNPLSIFRRPANENIGFPANATVYGHPDGDCGTWIEEAMEHFDAELFIFPDPQTGQKTIHFENKFHFNNVAVFNIPNTGPVGFTHNYPQPYGTNLSECPSNYFLEFQIDQADEGTFRRYAGTTINCTVSQIITNNEECVSHSSGKKVSLSTALAKRKEYLNPVENYLNAIFEKFTSLGGQSNIFLNAVINQMSAMIALFGGQPAQPLGPLSAFSPITARLEWLELSNDDFSIPKVFIGYNSNGDWLIKKTNETLVSAKELFNRFHGKNLATRGNQQEVYYDKEFVFCCDDYNRLKFSNVVTVPTTPAGQLGKLISGRFDLHSDRLLNVNYVTFVTSTNNLKETISIDGA